MAVNYGGSSLTFCIRPVKEFETYNYQNMKLLDRITSLLNTLNPLLVLCGVRQSIFRCDVCGYDDKDCGIGGWSVTNELWSKYGNGKGMMCMNCFEKKLGRKLSAKDFTATMDNHSHKKVKEIFINEGFSVKAGWATEIHFKDVWRD